jgi:hypothetical protein
VNILIPIDPTRYYISIFQLLSASTMLRRLANRLNRNSSDTDLSGLPPNASSHSNKDGDEGDSKLQKTQFLSAFDNCVETCDALAASSTSSGRPPHPATGLADCAVLVSADGELLIIPQQQQSLQAQQGHEQSSTTNDNSNNDEGKASFDGRAMEVFSKDLGEEYESAVFMGNDFNPTGDKDLNGFSAKGWSLPAATLAMQQTQDDMNELAEFIEDMVLLKKESAAKESQAVDRIRHIADSPELSPDRQRHYQQWTKQTFPFSNFEVLPYRVGPISSAGGTVNACVAALEQYYSTMAEEDSRRWREATQQMGLLTQLKNAHDKMKQRAGNRQKALVEMVQKTRFVEDQLRFWKDESRNRWNAVHEAEENVTKMVEEQMMERSRLREEKRLEKLQRLEENRLRNIPEGETAATSSEIWDIVSQVTASMDESSFAPIDLPSPHDATAPKNNLEKATSEDTFGSNDTGGEDDDAPMPMVDRHELEQVCGLPDLRVAAIAADEMVEDVSADLLTVLANFDITSRSARIAAETALVSGCKAQATCLRAMVKMERECLEQRLKSLEELEEVADNMDVRLDMNHYITLDKKQRGGKSMLADDDDGGIASALAVLNSHIEGNTGMGSAGKYNAEGWADANVDGEDATSPEELDELVECIFAKNALLKKKAKDSEKKKEACEKFEATISRLEKIAKDKTLSQRSKRSTICYALNSKRTSAELRSEIQFDGLCRVFDAVLLGCDTDGSGVALAKMMMMLSQTFYMVSEGGRSDSVRADRIYVKNRLVNHPLWEKDEFWDQALYQCVAESLTHSGVMTNFDSETNRKITSSEKKRSEWTETRKMKWHDLKHEERYEAASQVHAVVFAQLGSLGHSMIEFGCGLERSSAFIRRMAVRNQLPMTQRSMLLQHLIDNDGFTDKTSDPLKTPTK